MPRHPTSEDLQRRIVELEKESAERKRAEEALRERELSAKRAAEVNRTMAELGRIIGSTLSIDEVYEQFAAAVKRIIPFDRVMIGLIHEEERTWTIAYSSGIAVDGRRVGDVLALTGFMQGVFRKRSGAILHIKDEKELLGRYPLLLPSYRAGMRSIMAAPLITKDQVIGVIHFSSFSSRTYTEEDVALARDVAGQIAGAVANTLVLARMRKAEEALRESEQRFRNIFDNTSDAVHIHDMERHFLEVNEVACRRLGYTRDELLRMTLMDVDTPEFAGRIRDRIRDVDAMTPMVFESVHRRKDGSEIPVEINSRRIEFEGKPSILSVARDITERKQAERLQAQLLEYQKMESVGRLAGGVAHDFNNMLGIIIGRAEMAALQVSPDTPVYRNLQQIIRAGHRSAETVRQLLGFARRQTINPVVLDLNETISGMLKMFRKLVGEDIELIWIPGKDAATVRMDPSQVDQILANLVVNGRDAIPGVGKITIESACAAFDERYCREHAGYLPGKYVLLSVSDTGAGMSRDVMENLFEPFFTTKEVGKGSGLGLATVYGIVKQNNGFIDVHSEPGQGTTFKIFFPRFEGAGALPPRKSADAAPKGHETILLVEDEGMLLEIAGEILSGQGYRVLSAQTPNEALSISSRRIGGIHLLLTDVVMPEMNGKELSDRLKLARPGLKCIFMSGYTADMVAHHGVLDEGVDFIEKPFSAKFLTEKVRSVLDRPK